MLLNEHQSKLLFSEAGINVPEGILLTPASAASVTPEWPAPWYLKAQVLAGGRGKAGGILRIEEQEDIAPLAEKIFAMTIKDKDVPLIRLEKASEPIREFYCSFTVVREMESLVLTVGRQGGVEIENLDESNLMVQTIPMSLGLTDYHIRAAFFHMGVDKIFWPKFQAFLKKLYSAVIGYGLLLAEINPLVLTEEQEWLALDGKVEIDDNALFKRSDLERFYSPEHASREENIAREAGLAFHSLSGRIGLMVNGAGLAMATMDLLNYSGLPAANFMDLGGGADLDRMRTAMTLLFDDKSVEAVFINIFGGVLSCKKVAMALFEALDGEAPDKPLVVRLSGNEAEEGREVLAEINSDKLILVEEMNQAIAALKELEGEGDASLVEPSCDLTSLAVQKADADLPSFPAGLPFEKGMPVLVQGITGRTAQLHTGLMLEYGTHVVAGVTPFKGGQEVQGVPVYNSVREAMSKHDITVSMIFVPAPFAPDAILEAAQAGVPWIICITDGLTQQDMLRVREQMRGTKSRLIGPNCPGLIAPGRTKVGIMPGYAFTPGPVAVLSRSGTLTYEAAARLSCAGIGQSLCVGIGGDPFIGSTFTDMVKLLAEDDNTEAIVLLGEIGGTAEEDLAAWVTETGFTKPVVSFIAGQTAPPGKRLGHAGAILESGKGIEGKLETMRQAGFTVCPDLAQLPELVRGVLK